MKYLRAASPDCRRRWLKAARTYRASDRISRPRNTRIRSLASAITMAPDADTSASTWNSTFDAFTPQVAVGHQGGQQHGAGHQDGHQDAEPVHHHGVVDGGKGAVVQHVGPLPQ